MTYIYSSCFAIFLRSLRQLCSPEYISLRK